MYVLRSLVDKAAVSESGNTGSNLEPQNILFLK